MKASYKSKCSGEQYSSKKWKHSEKKEAEDLNAMVTAAAKRGAQEAMEQLQHKNKKIKKNITSNSEEEYNQFAKLRINDSGDDGYETAESN